MKLTSLMHPRDRPFNVITGVVIVGAVILDAWRHHLTGRRFALLKLLFPQP